MILRNIHIILISNRIWLNFLKFKAAQIHRQHTAALKMREEANLFVLGKFVNLNLTTR